MPDMKAASSASLDEGEKGEATGVPRPPVADSGGVEDSVGPGQGAAMRERLRDRQDTDVDRDREQKGLGAMSPLPRTEGALVAGSVQHTADQQRLATGIPKCEIARFRLPVFVNNRNPTNIRVAVASILFASAVLQSHTLHADEHMMSANLTRHMSADEELWVNFTEVHKLPAHSEVVVSKPKAPYQEEIRCRGTKRYDTLCG